MAGLWEPVNGVFWSTPPVAQGEGWQFSAITIWGLVGALLVPPVLNYILRTVRPQGWGLRNHLGTVGAVATLAYLAIILPLIWARLDTVMIMPLNEIGDFLAGTAGPLAFFWLVIGFFQQGEELRIQATELKNSVAQQAIMAEAAMKQAEAQRDARVRGLLANFAIQVDPDSSFIGSGIYTNGLKFRNDGNIARNVSIMFSPKFPSVRSEWFGDMKHGEEREVAIKTDFNEPSLTGEIFIEYEDVESTKRLETFIYRYDGGFIEFEKVLLPGARELGAGVPAQ